jgi:hypothetical protein
MSNMGDSRASYRLVVAALGAVLLAIAVFLPWYGVSFTAHGIAFVQQVGDQATAQYGNAALRSYLGTFHASLAGLAGHEFIAVTAHEALKQINVVLLIAAGLGIVIALIGLAGPESSAETNRGPLALLGALAAALVLFRILVPPSAGGDTEGVLALSVREGGWLALLGALAMLGSALWPRRREGRQPSQRELENVWSGLSGWTPEAE